ncbi:Auxin response factor 1 [Morella rubra]|uniref:Auxin response factor 1 n=1 Tax=Morella rubra TaxID=262757 RepID=A0A6A1VBQ6_9ROSI|nr:Auxin response factor 1 [Morella rubra]
MSLVIVLQPIYCSEFCSMVRKIFIYTTEEAKRLSPKAKLPVPTEAKPGKLDTEVAVNTEDQSSIVGHGF